MNVTIHWGALVTVVLLTVCYQAKTQTAQPDSIAHQLNRLLASKDPLDREVLHEQLQLLAASKLETDMALAASYYYQLKNTRTFDSICAAQVTKFPKGVQARVEAQQAISRIKSLSEMEKAYNAFIKDFPPDNYTCLPLGEDRLPYDRLRSNLAGGYAKEKNVKKVSYYAGLLEADFWKVRVYSELAQVFNDNGDIGNASLYQKKTVETAQPYAEGKRGNSSAANFAAKRYPEECSRYAAILYKQKNYNEALQYIEIAVKATKQPGPEFNYNYAKILAALNRNQEAYSRIETVAKSGKANEEMAVLFKTLYTKLKGTDVGFDIYQAALHAGAMNNLRARLLTKMINEPAYHFTLTDLQGNKVTLAELKGKIVILDFWATWCVPCKASFPAMQIAVNKYKSDSSIQFLFIHTWERTPTPAADAKDYIARMKYNFQVLMDTKDPETKANTVVDKYHVTSIPAKFVIDEKGNIRFRLTGFDGSNEAAVEELSMIIDLIREKN